MKKFVKAALAVALLGFSSSLFAAQPESFLKGTTFGLFEDEVVDNLAWGVEDTTGLVLGGYDPTNYNFNIGIGAWLGSFWYSVYEQGSFRTNITDTQSVTNDVVAKDGVNTDYVDTDKSSTKNRSGTNALHNNLYISFATGDWGIQSYWKYADTTPAGDYGKKSEYTEDKASGQTWSRESKRNRYNGTNTFGAYFNGIGIDDNFFIQLDQFEVAWGNNSTKNTVSTTYKQNGATWTGREQYQNYDPSDPDTYEDYNTKETKDVNVTNTFTPKVVGSLGFDLPDLGDLTSKFVLEEAFTMGLTFYKNENSGTRVIEDINSKRTEKYTNKSNQKANITWTNTLTPQFVFDFDVGERLSVKAKADVAVALSGYTTGKAYTGINTYESTYYNKIEKTTTKYYEKNVYMNGGNTQLSKTFSTKLSPKTDLALVYEVKPEKFNLNIGAEWNIGTYTWTTVTKTNQVVKTTYYSESTNEAGTKTVNDDSVSYVNRVDGPAANDNITPETKVTTYAATAATVPVLKIGATWFITEKASLDIAYRNSFETSTNKLGILNSGNGGLLGSELKLMFSVKF